MEEKPRLTVEDRCEITHHFHLHGGYAKQSALGKLGVLSLTERHDHPLMWAHYADAHRGFAIGLSTAHDFLTMRDPRTIIIPNTIAMGGPALAYQQVPPLCKVMYQDQAVSMLRTDPRIIIATSRFEVFDFAEFLFKSTAWEYEQEWRAFRRLANDGPNDRAKARNIRRREGFDCHEEPFVDAMELPVCTFDVPKAAIIEILIGLTMPAAGRRAIAEALVADGELAHVRLRVARTTPDFGLDFDDVEPTKLLEALLDDRHLISERLLSDLRECLPDTPANHLAWLSAAIEGGDLETNVPLDLLRRAMSEISATRGAGERGVQDSN